MADDTGDKIWFSFKRKKNIDGVHTLGDWLDSIALTSKNKFILQSKPCDISIGVHKNTKGESKIL